MRRVRSDGHFFQLDANANKTILFKYMYVCVLWMFKMRFTFGQCLFMFLMTKVIINNDLLLADFSHGVGLNGDQHE